MERFCKNCGKPLKEDQRYCVYCGYDSYQADQTEEEKYPEEEKDLGSSSPSLGRSEGKKNSLAIVLGIGAVLVILIGVGLYFFFGQKEDNTPSAATSSSAVEETGQPTVSEPAAGTLNPAETKDLQEQILGLDYMPKPWLKLHYHEIFMDNDEQSFNAYTANLSQKIPVSQAGIYLEGEPEEYSWVTHYLVKEDGIYAIDESDLNEAIRILPAVIKKGDNWSVKLSDGTMEMKIIEVGVNCDLGFTTLKNCVVVDTNFKDMDYRIYRYFAPGLGLVKEESPYGNNIILELTAYKEIEAAQAVEIVGEHAAKLAEMEAMLK